MTRVYRLTARREPIDRSPSHAFLTRSRPSGAAAFTRARVAICGRRPFPTSFRFSSLEVKNDECVHD